LAPKVTNERSLDAAVKYASDFMNKAVKPVMVGGVKMRWPGKAQDAFIHLSEAGNCSGSPLPLYNALIIIIEISNRNVNNNNDNNINHNNHNHNNNNDNNNDNNNNAFQLMMS